MDLRNGDFGKFFGFEKKIYIVLGYGFKLLDIMRFVDNVFIYIDIILDSVVLSN